MKVSFRTHRLFFLRSINYQPTSYFHGPNQLFSERKELFVTRRFFSLFFESTQDFLSLGCNARNELICEDERSNERPTRITRTALGATGLPHAARSCLRSRHAHEHQEYARKEWTQHSCISLQVCQLSLVLVYKC